MDARDLGFVLGVLVGEGHFGGDGKQPHITVRMHTRHEQTLRFLAERLPGGRLYGPYHHGGRSYVQFMVRGEPLRRHVVPLLREHLDLFDDHVRGRFEAMCVQYCIE